MRKLVLLFLALAATPTFADDSDKDYLTAFLEDSLSDAGREVTVTGFAGALSSQAAIETLTIADADGIWLTLEGVTLDWRQSALLSGELVVNELSARHLSVTRLPKAEDSALPSPEAQGFSLPELPVSIGVGKMAIDEIDLAAAVLGQPVSGRLDAAMTLADGAGLARLDLVRSGEGPAGEITLFAGYDNMTRQLELVLSAGEDAGGLVAQALGLPGNPATDFHLKGSGPIDAFAATIKLATDGEERLAGSITLAGEVGDALRLKADLTGNLAPLFLPEYAEFLGDRLDLTLDAQRAASGALSVDNFRLKAQSVSVEGSARIAADGLPESVALTGLLANPDGGPLLLPFGGAATWIDRAAFEISTTHDAGLGWTATASIDGLSRPDLSADLLDLAGKGRVDRSPTGNSFTGAFQYAATGLAPADPGLAKAIGPNLSGGLTLDFVEGDDALRVSGITLNGQGLQGSGDVQIAGLDAGFLTSGKLALNVDDLSRFDIVTGLPLAGSGSLGLEGSASQLSGELDGVITLTAKDLRVGIDQLDHLLQGESFGSLSLLRDETGTTIRSLDLTAGAMAAQLSGKIESADSNLAGKITLGDLAALDPDYSGSAALDLALTGAGATRKLALSGTTEGLAIGNSQADKLLAGTSQLAAELGLGGDRIAVDTLQLSNNQLDLSVIGSVKAGGQEFSIRGTLADLGLLVPDLNGALSVSGMLVDDGAGYFLDLVGKGPGKIDAKVAGTVAPDLASADLKITGSAQAGLANLFIAPRVVEGPTRFDLRFGGPLELASLAGRLTLSNGRLSDPGLGFSLQDIEAQADLKAGKAQIAATAALSTGGKLRLDGPVGLTGSYPAELSIALDRVRFFDPKLYETVLAGDLAVKGPLAGGALVSGALALSEAELRVPESGIDAAGLLIEIDHRHEPADVRATRIRAGLLDPGGGSHGASSGSYRLDLLLSAPSRIFLRGRGIDAELGGELRLGGTTTAIVPSGEFSLIRGRLDILGKRLVLETANLMLEGSFTPQLEISASSESDGVQSFVTIDGAADDPDVGFSSMPELPQEEVLSRLLFGRGLDSISALQAAQLAQAVAVLAGRGGEGVISRLRKGFGLDDLDVATAEDGTTALKAGKYITDNIYTEVEIDQAGTSKINLNLDLRPGVTVKGRVGADGETGIGIFIEKDY